MEFLEQLMIIVCSSDRLLHVLEPLLCSVSHSGDRRQPRLRGELVLRAWYMVLRAAYQGVLRVSLWVGGSTSELSGISRAVLEHLFSLLIKPTHRTTTCAHVLSPLQPHPVGATPQITPRVGLLSYRRVGLPHLAINCYLQHLFTSLRPLSHIAACVGWRELDRSKPASSCGMRSAGGKPSISPRLRTRLSAPTLLTITLVAAMCGVSPMGDAAGTALRLYDVPAGMAGTDDRMHRAVSQVGAILANILTALRTVPMTACGVLARRSDDRRSLVACWFREGGKAGAVARSSPAKCPCHPDASR